MPPERLRGPYRRYLNDINIPVPGTTAWRRRREQEALQQQQNLQEEAAQQINNAAEADDFENEDQLEQSDDDYDGLSNLSSRGHRRSDNSSNESVKGSVSEGSEIGSEIADRPEPAVRTRFVFRDTCSDSDGGGGGDSDPESNGSESNGLESSDSSLDSDDELEEWDNAGLRNHENVFLPPRPAQAQQNNEADNGNHWLYEGSRLTKSESDILIMSFIIRWGLEEASIEHLLQLINCHLPQPTLGSQYLFLKKFPTPGQQNIIFTCPKCLDILPEFTDEGEVQCEECEDLDENTLNKKMLKEDGNYFVQLSIAEQIRNILQSNTLFSLLRKECEESDVISGSCYASLRQRGVIGDDDLTLQWNTDSVSPYKKAKMQVWPILAAVNELPYHARRENMILCGLYYSRSKPNINAFLKPFVDELESLHSDGIQVTLPVRNNVQTTIKVHTLLSSVDSVARPVLQGLMQFNSKQGCSFCLKTSVEIERGKGRCRVYTGGAGAPRTMDQHMQAIETLAHHNRNNRQQKDHIQGVKHHSVLLQLSNFHIILSFVPDYLHNVLEGVVKTFMKHWLDATYKDSDWYLTSRKRTLLSQRVQSILPPVEITRKPRGLDELKLFKASEFRHFLLYYSIVCLKGILPPRYLKHWFLLVYSIVIYLKEKFTAEEASRAKLAIHKFVEGIAALYPDCIHLYTFNVHLLVHIPSAVKRWGGLWASSTFPYEHFNGIIARLMSGTRSRPEQVCRSFLRLRCISHRGSNLFQHPNSEDGKRLFDSLMTKYRSSNHSENFHRHCRLFGAPEMYELSLVERVAIQHCLGVEAVHNIARSFRRLIYKGVVYHASCYEILKVRDNSTVRMNDGQMLSILRILLVRSAVDNAEVCVVLGEFFQLLDENLAQDFDLNLFSGDLIHVCHKTERLICRKIQDLHQKCVKVPYGNAYGIVPLVNTLERD